MVLNIREHTTIGIVGQKGTGKTRYALQLANQAGINIVYVDPVGIAVKYKLMKGAYVIVKGLTDFRSLKGQLANKRQNYVFDVSYLRRDELIVFMDMLSRVLLEVGNYGLFIDEAPEFLPQGGSKYYSEELERTIRIGRNFGIRPILLITQRPQRIDKNAFALCDCYMFFRVVYPLDRGKIRELLNLSEDEFAMLGQQLMSMSDGEAILFYPEKYKGNNLKEALVRIKFAGVGKNAPSKTAKSEHAVIETGERGETEGSRIYPKDNPKQEREGEA